MLGVSMHSQCWLTPSGLERIPVHQFPEIRKTVFAVSYYNALGFFRVTMPQIKVWPLVCTQCTLDCYWILSQNEMWLNFVLNIQTTNFCTWKGFLCYLWILLMNLNIFEAIEPPRRAEGLKVRVPWMNHERGYLPNAEFSVHQAEKHIRVCQISEVVKNASVHALNVPKYPTLINKGRWYYSAGSSTRLLPFCWFEKPNFWCSDSAGASDARL